MTVVGHIRLFAIRALIATRNVFLAPVRHLRRNRVEVARREGCTFESYVRAVGCRMTVDPEMFFSEVYIQGAYESGLVRYLKRTLRPGMVCLDVGANVGYFSLLMAKRVGSQGQVIAFEPTRSTFEVLQRNVRLNGQGNVVCEALAVSDHDGSVSFHVGSPGFDVYNTAGEITHPSALCGAYSTTVVPSVALDSYLGERRMNRVDVIKIDVEGAELSVLKGMEETLYANSHAKLIVEFNRFTASSFGYSLACLGSWLTERGWQLSNIHLLGNLSPASVDDEWMSEMIVASRDGSAVDR